MSEEEIKERLDKLEATLNKVLALQRLPLGVGAREEAGLSTQSHHHCGGSGASLICLGPEMLERLQK